MAHSWQEFVAGVVGGGSGIFVGQPLDTIRVRLQTQTTTGGAVAYDGIRDCFSKTVTNEGFAGLFRGLSPPLVSVSVQNSILFASYGGMRRLLADRRGDPPSSPHLNYGDIYIAGSAAGVACSVVTAPTELIKCRLQCVDRWRGVSASIADILKQGGIAGLYRGYWVTLLRDAPSYGLYFGSYEWSRQALSRAAGSSPDNVAVILAAGGVAGSLSWSAIYPLDVVKSRLQAHPDRYRGMVDCFTRSCRAEGYGFLVRGLTATVMRAFPVNSVTFLMYELCMRVLGSPS